MRRFRKGRLCWAVSLLAGSAAISTPARAADAPGATVASPLAAAPVHPFFLRLGVTGSVFDQSLAGTRIAGQPLIGGGLKTGPVVSAYAEAGYFVTQQIAVSVSGGSPPSLAEKGTGTLAPFGTLARERVGALTATAHYHFDLGRLHPYVGGGLAYAVVFHDGAAAIARPALHDGVGGVVVGGIDVDLDTRWRLFVDVKNIWVAQRLSGLAAPVPGGPSILPLKTRLHTDVVLVTGGVGYRF